MSKGNALTALKVKVKRLEEDAAVKEQALLEARQGVAKLQHVIDLMAEEGKSSLLVASQSIQDLRSVNSELRDAVEEVQDKRDQYKRWLHWLVIGTAAYFTLDTLFYVYLIWG